MTRSMFGGTGALLKLFSKRAPTEESAAVREARMRWIVSAVIALAILCVSRIAAAEPPPYREGPGVWMMASIHVDPASLDKYVARLQKTERVYLETLKARGIIDDYSFVVRRGGGKDLPNFMMKIHYVNFSMLGTNWEHDSKIMDEVKAKVEKNGGSKIFPEFGQFREILDEGYWVEVRPAE
jgi:hypothetical protein